MEPVARLRNVDQLRLAGSQGAPGYGVNMGINAGQRHARKEFALSRLHV
jgi:hypothetical protein